MDHAPQVDVEDEAPLRERQLPGEALHDDARVVHRDVQVPEVLGEGRPAGPVHRVRVGHVDDQRRAHRRHHGAGPTRRPEPDIVEVGHEHDASARGDERFGDGEADPARRTGDDRGAAVELR